MIDLASITGCVDSYIKMSPDVVEVGRPERETSKTLEMILKYLLGRTFVPRFALKLCEEDPLIGLILVSEVARNAGGNNLLPVGRRRRTVCRLFSHHQLSRVSGIPQ